MKYRFLTFCTCCSILMAAAFIGGCSGAKKQITIAVIERTGGTQYWSQFTRVVREEAERRDYSILWSMPPTPTSYDLQVQMLNAAIARKVDGIILAPSHQLVLADGVRRARAAGIPVVIVDSPIELPPSEYVSYIACSDDAIGYLAAQRISAVLGDRAKVLIIGSSPTLEGSTLREQSLERALKVFAPGSTVVSIRYSLSDWARARQATLDALEADPEINAIFASDEFSTHGVLTALKSLGARKPPVFIGVGEDVDDVNAVRSGIMTMAIIRDSSTMGHLAMTAISDALDHKPVEKIIQTHIVPVNARNIDDKSVQSLLQSVPLPTFR